MCNNDYRKLQLDSVQSSNRFGDTARNLKETAPINAREGHRGERREGVKGQGTGGGEGADNERRSRKQVKKTYASGSHCKVPPPCPNP